MSNPAGTLPNRNTATKKEWDEADREWAGMSLVPPVLVDSTYVAGLYSICTRTLWRFVQEGRIPQPIRMTRKMVRWRLAEVEAAIAMRTILGDTKSPFYGLVEQANRAFFGLGKGES